MSEEDEVSVNVVRNFEFQTFNKTVADNYKNMMQTVWDEEYIDTYARMSISDPKAKVVYNSNGGANVSGTYTYTIGAEYGNMPVPAARLGYEFLGWFTSATDGIEIDETTIVGDEVSPINTTTLYAHWKLVGYTITYVLNGGTNSTANPDAYLRTAALTFKNPTRTGYTFAGWYTSSTYATKITGLALGSTGNKTVYAKWTANKYIIKFTGNGANSGSMAAMTNRLYNQTYALTANAYKRTGYTFTGWNTRADGKGTQYANKASVRNLTSVNGKTIALYAQWVKTKYTISYSLLGGTNSKSNPTYYYYSGTAIALKNPSRKGYTFNGWYTTAKFTTKSNVINAGSAGNKTFYAKWTVNKYNIKFNGNGAISGAMSALTNRVYTSAYKLPAVAYKRTGYTFTGWNTRADGKGTKYANGATVKGICSVNGGTVTLYAQWSKIKYKISYVLDGGENNSANLAYYYYSGNKITLYNPTKTGYTFAGWYTSTSYKTRVTYIAAKATGNKTLYAKWIPLQ